MTATPSQPPHPDDRLQQGKFLWEKVLQSKYFDDDVYDRSVEVLGHAIGDIRNFLKSEPNRHEDRPSAARSLGLLQISLTPSRPKAAEELLSLAFLKMGLMLLGEESAAGTPSNRSGTETPIESALAEIASAIEMDGDNYLARTGPYSSIYAALLALLLDEITIRNQLDSLERSLEDPDVIGQLTERVMKPGPLFLTAYYRGQRRRDWLPLPKTLRGGDPSKSRIGRFCGWLRGLVREARFGAGIGRLKLPGLNRLRLDAIRQHYGFPTSLLDFSTNLEVAAFFATQNAQAGETGVIYRYHLSHPYALTVLASYTAGVEGAGFKEMARQMKAIAANALRGLKIVHVEGVDRIKRQDGVFINGVNLSAAHNFLQPVYFCQQQGLDYNNPGKNITQGWLFPTDDPIAKMAESILRTHS